VIALDSSVVIASFGAWHEHHTPARGALRDAPSIAAHVALEAYSVLTRLPNPYRARPAIVIEFLARTFPGPRLALDLDGQTGLPERLAGLGVVGGAAHDGLIALTARAAGATLLTLDRRAAATYRRCEVETRLLA